MGLNMFLEDKYSPEKAQASLTFNTLLRHNIQTQIYLAHRIRISEILPWDRKSYLTHAILPRTSSNVIM